MLRFPAAAARSVTAPAAALQRFLRAGATRALVSAPASAGYPFVVSSVRCCAALSALQPGAARISSAAAAAAAAPPSHYTVWVKKEGDPGFMKLRTSADDVSDLMKEIAKELSLTERLTTLALYTTDEHGKTKTNQEPLKNTETLAEALPAAVQSGGKYFLIIKEVVNFPPLPPPLTFAPVDLGGETWMQTSLTLSNTAGAPFFLTKAQHAELERFIMEEPSKRPQALMPVGTIKSGKSTVLHEVLPGMLAAQYETDWPSTRHRPVIFTFQFLLDCGAEAAAWDLCAALNEFGCDINVPFDHAKNPTDALDTLPIKITKFAQRIKSCGGELWLLLDELQAPGLHSTVYDAQRFTHKFKHIVERVSPLGRIVVTGSGLVTLLNSIRTTAPNGFALWHAMSFLSLGREPPAPTVQSMAAAMLQQYAAHWNATARHAITPATIVDELQVSAHAGLTSPRPALLAFALGCMGDAQKGTPVEVVKVAVRAVLNKMKHESVRDTASALASLDSNERRVLLDIAAGTITVAELEAICEGKGSFEIGGVRSLPETFAHLLTLLREEGTGSDVVRLQPPYSALLESWIRSNGDLAVRVDGDKLDLDTTTNTNLFFIAEERTKVPHALRRKAGTVLLESLARNGVGIREGHGPFRAPQTAAEFNSIAALRALQSMLSKNKRSDLNSALKNAAAGVPFPAGTTFEETIGWELLLAFRHFKAHVWADPSSLVRNGLRAAVVAECVCDVAYVLAEGEDSCFIFNGALLRPNSP